MKEYTQDQLLVREVEAVFEQFIHAPNEQSFTVMTLWTLHTHLRSRSGEFLPYITPRLYFGSKIAGCGKSLALKITARLSHNGEVVLNPTPPSINTLMNVDHSTIGFDELDTYFRRDGGGRDTMRAVLNGGYEAETFTTRERAGKIDRQNIHGPIALAGKNANEFLGNDNYETLRTRTISIILDRKPAGAYVDQYDPERHNPRLRGLMDRIKDWGLTNAREICSVDVSGVMDRIVDPDTEKPLIVNRDREIWTVLFRIAEFLGDEWPKRIEQAARSFVLGEWGSTDRPCITPAQELVACVQAAFADEDEFLSTDEILFRVGNGSLRPSLMGEWTTKRSAEMGLSSALKVQLDAKAVRRQVDGDQAMGYTRSSVGCPEVPAESAA